MAWHARPAGRIAGDDNNNNRTWYTPSYVRSWLSGAARRGTGYRIPRTVVQLDSTCTCLLSGRVGHGTDVFSHVVTRRKESRMDGWMDVTSPGS